MKNTLLVLLLVVLLSGFSQAAITYNNGQYNVLNSFVNGSAFVMDNPSAQSTTLEIVSGGNIFGHCYVYGSSNVILNEGNIRYDLIVYDSSIIEMQSGSIGDNIFLYNNSQCIISSGSVVWPVYTNGNSVLTIEGGTLYNNLVVSETSTIYFESGGSVQGDILLNNSSTLIQSGGNIGRHLFAEDISTVEMSGGWIDGNMYSRHDAEITIIGTNFNYPLGYITDASGALTGTLANGDPINVPFVREGNGVILLKDPSIFITVLTPNGGERYLTEKPVSIEYIITGAPISTIDIDYSTDNGSSWITIVTGISNTGTYEWTTPNVESEISLVRVSSSDNPTITDVSDNTFIIFSCSEINLADVNSDCYVDFSDFVLFSGNWLWCGDRYNPICQVQ